MHASQCERALQSATPLANVVGGKTTERQPLGGMSGSPYSYFLT